MNESVDTRVVEARFDSAQFEKGVDRTVKKLDELKKSLQLSDGSKTITEFAEKTESATQKASDSLEKLQNRFTSFTGMLKQKLLSGIADEIVGIFFKLTNAFNGFVKSLSTGQIGYGMQRYTDILTSVRTLVSAGVNQDVAYESIERLGLYADQTSYSLDAMVSTMSKLKTAGADIKTATKMVEGLSNAAASMGVNATEAQRAYLNFQQAYSSGAMTQRDWISFESLPMVGSKFNQTILDAAVEVGTLKKEKNGTYSTTGKKGVKGSAKGITAENMGTKLAPRWFNKEVMEKVFAEAYYFENIDVDQVNSLKAKERAIKSQIKQEIAAGALSEDQYDEEYQKRFQKILDEEYMASDIHIEKQKELNKAVKEGKMTQEQANKALEEFDAKHKMTVFQYDAFRAGQEARSFIDVINTLKDTISRGWATSFELIFGKLDEAADFFTELTEGNLANAIYRIGELRNMILEKWNLSGGRDNMLGAIREFDELLGDIFEKIGLIERENEIFDQETYDNILREGGKDAADRYRASTGIDNVTPYARLEKWAEEFGDRLAILTRNVRDFFNRIREWFNEDLGGGETRLKKISDILSQLGTILGGVGRIGGIAFSGFFDMIGAMSPLITSFFDLVNKLLEPISSRLAADSPLFTYLNDIIGNIAYLINRISELLAPLLPIIGDISGFFIDMFAGSIVANIQFVSDALGLILEAIFGTSNQMKRGQGVFDGIKKDVEAFGKVCKSALNSITAFFGAVIADLKKILGLADDTGSPTDNGGIFSNIINFFDTNEFIQNVKNWVNQALIDVGDFITITIPKKVKQLPSLIGSFFESLFYTKTTSKVQKENGRGKQIVTTLTSTPLKQWLDNIINAVSTFITVTIPEAVKSIPSFIGSFFESLFYTKTTSKVQKENGRGKQIVTTLTPTPLKQWLDNAVKTVKKFITVDVPNGIKKIPSLIETFFTNLFYKKSYKKIEIPNGKGQITVTTITKTPLKQFLDTVILEIKKFIKDIPKHIQNAIGGIGTFFKSIWEGIFGTNQNGTGSSGSGIIDGIVDGTAIGDRIQQNLEKPFLSLNINNILNWLKELGISIYNGILSIFTGSTDFDFNNNWLSTKVESAIRWIGTNAETAWNSAKDFIVNLPTTIANIFTGNNVQNDEGTVGSAILGLGTKIGEWLSQLPSLALKTWQSTETAIGNFWDTVIGVFTGRHDEKKFTKAQKEEIEHLELLDPSGYAATQYKRSIAKSPIIKNLEQFFHELIEYITNRIKNFPTDLANGLSQGVSILNTLFETVDTWFTEDGKGNSDKSIKDKEGKDSPFLEALKNLGEVLYKFIVETLPKFIVDGFNWIKEHADEWIKGISGLFSPGEKKLQDETDKGILGVIKERIQKVPTMIVEAFAAIPNLFRKSTFDQFTYDNILREGGFDSAERYKAYSSNPIYDFFAGLVGSIGDLFANAGPVILNGINRALQWIQEQLGKATEFFSKLVSKNMSIDEMLSTEAEGEDVQKWKPMWEAVKSIGRTIKSIIIDTIPGFIMSAVDYIAQQTPGIFSRLFGADDDSILDGDAGVLSEDTYETIVEKNKDNALEAVDNATSKTDASAPKSFLQRVLDGITSLFISSAKAEDLEYGTEDVVKNVSEGMLSSFSEGISKAVSKTAKKAEKSNIWDKILGFFATIFTNIEGFIKSLGDSKVAKLIVIVGAILLFLHEIRIIADSVNAIDDVGWSAKWIAISALIALLTTILGYIAVLTQDDNNFDEQGNPIGKLKHIKELMKDFLKEVKEIMYILAAIMALAAAKEFFGWRKEASKNKGNKNVTKIKAKKGSTVNIVNSFNDEATYAMGGLENLFLGSGGILNTVLGGFLGKVSTSAGLYVGGDFIGQMVEDLAGNANDALGSLGSGLNLFVSYLPDMIKNLKDIKGDVGIALEVVPEVVKLVKEFLELLKLSSEDASEEAGDIDPIKTATHPILWEIDQVTEIVAKISGALSLLKSAVSGYGDDITAVVKALQDILNMKTSMIDFSTFANSESFTYFKSALMALGSIFRLYSDAVSNGGLDEKPKEINIDNAIDALNMLINNNKFKEFIQKFNKDEIKKNFDDIADLELAERVIVFASAISSMAKACSELNVKDAEGINTLITILESLNISNASEEKVVRVTRSFGILGNGLASFGISTQGFTKEQFEASEYALKMLASFAVSLKELPPDSVLSKIFVGDQSIDNFGVKIRELGQNLKEFMVNVSNFNKYGQAVKFDADNINLALNALFGIVRVAKLLNNIKSDTAFYSSGFAEIGGKLPGLANNLITFIQAIQDMHDNHPNITDKTYGFVFKVIEVYDGISKAISRMAGVPNLNNIPQTFKAFNDGLFGWTDNSGDQQKGTLEYINTFVLGISGSVEQLGEKVPSAVTLINGIADLIATLTPAMMMLAQNAEISTAADGITHVGEAIKALTDQKDIYVDFFNMAGEFNQQGLQKAYLLVSTLKTITDMIATFANADMYKGLMELESYNWANVLNTISEQLEATDDEFFNPTITITPVMNFTDDFNKKFAALNSFIKSTDGTEPSMNLTFSADTSMQDLLSQIKPPDYTILLSNILNGVNSIDSSTSTFSTDLKNVEFRMDKASLVTELGPVINKWLGAEGYIIIRTNLK